MPLALALASPSSSPVRRAGRGSLGSARVLHAPRASCQQAATGVKRERATDVVVLLDERIFVLDEQHRLTRTTRMIYRVDSPDGVERWAASTAHWQPWHQARPTIRARVVTPDGREHQLDQKLLTRRPARATRRHRRSTTTTTCSKARCPRSRSAR